jgi:hypothetical protein
MNAARYCAIRANLGGCGSASEGPIPLRAIADDNGGHFNRWSTGHYAPPLRGVPSWRTTVHQINPDRSSQPDISIATA